MIRKLASAFKPSLDLLENSRPPWFGAQGAVGGAQGSTLVHLQGLKPFVEQRTCLKKTSNLLKQEQSSHGKVLCDHIMVAVVMVMNYHSKKISSDVSKRRRRHIPEVGADVWEFELGSPWRLRVSHVSSSDLYQGSAWSCWACFCSPGAEEETQWTVKTSQV